MPINIQQALKMAVKLLENKVCHPQRKECHPQRVECHPRESGDPSLIGLGSNLEMDPRMRGDDTLPSGDDTLSSSCDIFFDAEILLALALNQPRSYLRAWPEKELTAEQSCLFAEYITRRRSQEPIAYITGIKEFWSLPLLVTPETLIPRPETELLVEQVLSLFTSTNEPIQAADLGTGCGAIALALAQERPAWKVYAVDVSESALCIASKNAQRLGINNVSFYPGNWCTALPCKGFDVIVSNPPYISEAEWNIYAGGLQFEPRGALVSGEDGLDAVREIVQNAKMYLNSGGYIFLEHGYSQGAAVRELLFKANFSDIRSECDLSGQERVTAGVSA